MEDFAPVRTQRTFELISDRIREQLRAGALRPGDKLPAERELARQFGTSRNAVREALRSLEHTGVIELQKGARGGAFITDGNPGAMSQSMQDLLHLGGLTLSNVAEARLAIEDAVVALAAARAVPADFDRLDANIDAAEALAREGDIEAKTELNMEFHNLLAECTGNPVLVLLMRTLTELLRSVNRPLTAEDTGDVVRRRRRFMGYLRARDAAAAQAEMRAHLDRVHELFAAGQA